jgi:hypothetical protein
LSQSNDTFGVFEKRALFFFHFFVFEKHKTKKQTHFTTTHLKAIQAQVSFYEMDITFDIIQKVFSSRLFIVG